MWTADQIIAEAFDRKGPLLEQRFPLVRSPAELQAIPDDRYLAAMTLRVFSAGFVWRVIENKWPTFEQAFDGFLPNVVAAYDHVKLAELKEDTRVVRNGTKILATVENAQFVQDVAEEHGGFGAYLGQWSDEDLVKLWDDMKKRGSRLGGDSGPRFLRQMGRDTFIMTGDVTQALSQMGVITTKASTKSARRAANEAFVQWKAESGYPMAHLSLMLSCTV